MPARSLQTAIAHALALIDDCLALAKKCKKGKPCGDSCIPANRECHIGGVSLDSTDPMTTTQAVALLTGDPEHPVSKAMRDYFHGSSEPINAKPDAAKAKLVAGLLERLPPYVSEKPLYRGLSFDSPEARNDFVSAVLIQGGQVNDKTVMSTSKRLGGAKSFARRNGVLIEIRGHKTGRDLEPLAKAIQPQYEKQREVGFRKGASFKFSEQRQISVGQNEVPYLIFTEET